MNLQHPKNLSTKISYPVAPKNFYIFDVNLSPYRKTIKKEVQKAEK